MALSHDTGLLKRTIDPLAHILHPARILRYAHPYMQNSRPLERRRPTHPLHAFWFDCEQLGHNSVIKMSAHATKALPDFGTQQATLTDFIAMIEKLYKALPEEANLFCKALTQHLSRSVHHRDTSEFLDLWPEVGEALKQTYNFFVAQESS